MRVTVGSCLTKLGIALTRFSDCTDVDDEWSVVKRAYFKTALKTHPDKGGDAGAFREVQSAFDALRFLFDGASPDFLFSTSAAASAEETAPPMETPSWEYYQEAAQEAVPTYRVERAKSSRARCSAQGSARFCSSDDCIDKDSLRVGWLNSESGAYGGWVSIPTMI